jgi:hypothetical protein
MKTEHNKSKFLLICIAIIFFIFLMSKCSGSSSGTPDSSNSSNAKANLETVIAMENNGTISASYIKNAKKSTDECSIYYNNPQYSIQLTKPGEKGRLSCFPDGDLFSETSLTVNYPNQSTCDQEMDDATNYLKYSLKATSPVGTVTSQDGTTQTIYWDVGDSRKFMWGNYYLNLDEQTNNDGSCSVDYDLSVNA